MLRDDEFESFLKRDSELSKIYREGAVEEAPDVLDAPILAESREATRTRSSWFRLRLPAAPFTGAQWLVPLSTTAVIALAIGLVIMRPSPEFDPVHIPPGQTPVLDSSTLPAQDVRLPQSTKENASDTAPPQPKFDVLPDLSADLFRTGGVAEPSEATSETEGAKKSPLDPPTEWLMEIDRLLESGRLEEARIGFYAFRERYPSHPIPDDLLARLRM